MADILDSSIEILDKIDTQLDGVLSYLNNLTDLINEEIAQNVDNAQNIINEKVEQMSEKLTDKLQPIRDNIVSIFSSQVKVVKEKLEEYIQPISAFVTINWATGSITLNVPLDPNEIIDVVKGIILMLIPSSAIEFVTKFVTEVFPKISSISSKIQDIANYTPSITVPDVTVPPLNVNIAPITLADIMGE